VSKVYVVQVPARRSGPGGAWEEKYDLTPAREFGELVRLLDYGNVPKDPGPTRAALYRGLHGFDSDRDFLLLLGDPVACAQAVHVLGCELEVECFRVLKWDRRDCCYRPYVVGRLLAPAFP
jgi:hypothetical protein